MKTQLFIVLDILSFSSRKEKKKTDEDLTKRQKKKKGKTDKNLSWPNTLHFNIVPTK